MSSHHPFVSESHEGKPAFEWGVALCVVVSTVLAACGKAMAATALLSVTAIGTSVLRTVLRERSPWKIRSVTFDSICGISLGVILFGLFLIVLFLNP